jgi:riboflavin synthase
MFTGIVETTGILRRRELRGPGARLAIDANLERLVVGESIAVHGVCLTVQAITATGFESDASVETLARSTLGTVRIGNRVHLERSLEVGARLGGHIVSGHVDGKVRLSAREKLGEAEKLVFLVEDASLCRFIAPKGSVAVDGVSLTVNHAERDELDVVVIPHTLEVTTLGQLRVGDEANLEVDMLARYVARLLEVSAGRAPGRDEILLAKLRAAGFM